MQYYFLCVNFGIFFKNVIDIALAIQRKIKPYFKGTKNVFFLGKVNNDNTLCFHGQQKWAFRLSKKKKHNYGRSINPYIIFLGATKSQEQKRTAFFHDFGSLQLIASKICSFSPFTNEKTFSTKFCQ